MKFARRILKQSLPFSLIVILMSLYMRMDGFMLEQMLDDDAYQAGVYAASFRVYEAYNMIGYLFAVLLLPMFASLLSDRKKLLNLMTSSHNLILSVAGVLVVATFLFRQEIMLFLYPLNANSYYGELLGLHLLSFFAICLSYIYGTFLTANNNLTRLNKLLFTGVLINLTLNLLFIPTLGAKGAAYSTIFTQFFVLGGQYLLSLFELKLKIKYSLLLKRLLFIISIVVVGILFQNYVDLPGWISSFILLSIVFVAIALSFGFVNLKDLFNKEIE